MFKAIFSFCILFAAVFLFAAPVPPPLSPQERFDKLIERTAFSDADVQEFRDIMQSEDSGNPIDCSFCPDAFTWQLVSQGHFDEAAWLFDHKADFGIKDKDGMTLLHLACRGGHKEFAELLVKLGAEVNLPDDHGRTAIHYAVMSGNSKLVESLLELGSDPNKLTKDMETPLHFAAKYSGLEEVVFLVEHGASIKAINWTLVENLKDQRRRQEIAYYESSEKQVVALKSALGLKTIETLGDDDEDEDEDDDYGGARYADSFSDDRLSSGLFQFGLKEPTIDINHIPPDILPRDTNDAATTEGMTALHYAAEKGDIEVVKFLVEHEADIDAQDTVLSRTAIHLAAENGNLDCIKYLVEKGADVQDKDSYGATALHYAARSNHLDIVKFLVDKKVDYTAKDTRGWSAMHYAANGGSADIIKYLLAKGLNINELNKAGRTPLFFVRNNRELRQFMISKGAK